MRLKVGTALLFLLVLAKQGRALPGLLEGSGDYDDTEVLGTSKNPYAATKSVDDEIPDSGDTDGANYPEDDDDYDVTDDGSESVQSNATTNTKSSIASLDTGPIRFNLMESFASDIKPIDEDILDPIESDDGIYPEDEDDYNITDVGSESASTKSPLDSGPLRFNLMENFASDNDTFEPALTAKKEPEVQSCSGHKKLASQPAFVNSTVNVIRKCCPPGESIQLGDRPGQAALCRPGEPHGPFQVDAIYAAFYELCIEDLEEPVPPPLGVAYGNPCTHEHDMLTYSQEWHDLLYVVQNGSLLVTNGHANSCNLFDLYCLDVNRDGGALTAYVCYSEARWNLGGDIFRGQMLALALCLIFAIPLLLATAYFYVAIPRFNDIHGKALSLNCVNFAIALLLESIFQHRTKGNGSTDDTIVLANYAEYFILATFFWLLVNCVNNCIHAWYFLPRGIQIKMGGEKRTFALYAAFAQLSPLAIILLNPPHADHTAVKHYFFVPIIVIISLNLLSFVITYWGFQRVSNMLIDHYITRGRLSGTTSGDSSLANLPNIRQVDVNRAKYMTKYTAMLFVVMSGVWSVTIATYYTTRTIPILYDILFGLQGILIFIIFICLPRPFRTVKGWFQKNHYCGCHPDPDEVDLRRNRNSYRVSGTTNGANNGAARESVPLNNVTVTKVAS
ncbi:hypothetical protein pipiens_009925 [Culex pipiens pipiens]|uniref:Uncharacterized protein n=1 Tax=Culex pipiens pipiens TaxID=38569 RepID=A0ABD1DC85_CULPP